MTKGEKKLVSHHEMPPLRLQTFAASARIARTDLAEVEAAFDADIKTLEAASSPRNVGATPSKGASATADGSPGIRPETECMPVLSFCLSFLDMGPIFTDRDTYRLAYLVFEMKSLENDLVVP